ncbi:MAG: hypothetical protein KDD47_28550 [Acidobacteria bacterium]|nr:hypothetical protein [Acidobacteriota bacterium]
MSRKYSQKGYDEGSREESRGRRPPGPRPSREGPRGRGLGAERSDVFRCRDCGTAHPIFEEILAETTCSKCGKALHSCVNCANFDTARRFECRVPLTAGIASKTKANACEHFQPKVVQEFESDTKKDDDARSAFDALFKI